MSEGAFPVQIVKPKWFCRLERMGSKYKFWYRRPEEETRWLFKYPQENTGQHWAEKVAAAVAHRLDIPHAVVELASVRGQRGSATKSFAGERRYLLHGNELLAAVMPYDRFKRFGQSDHTLDNIFHVLDRMSSSDSAANRAKRQFASYIALDALVSNTDRHHENWALVVERTLSGYRGFLAPTFDHASSLGRELLDEARLRLLREGAVGRYSEKGRGAVYWTPTGRRGPSPLALLRSAAQEYPALFRPVLTVVHDRHETLEEVVDRVPDGWMSHVAKDFVVALIRYNTGEMLKCL